jgi:thiamine transporter ThiT
MGDGVSAIKYWNFKYRWNSVLIDASLYPYRLEAESGQNTVILLLLYCLLYALSPEQAIFEAYIHDFNKITFSGIFKIKSIFSCNDFIRACCRC